MRISSVSPSYNPYANSAAPAAATPQSSSAYGFDTAFFNFNRRATPDSAITKMGIGGLSGYNFAKSGLGGGFTQFTLQQAGIGAAISGTISAVKNVAALSHGRQDASTTVANVLTDTLQGSASAAGGVLGSWGTNSVLKALGATAGTPLMIATVLGGAVGAVGLNQILNTEALRRQF